MYVNDRDLSPVFIPDAVLPGQIDRTRKATDDPQGSLGLLWAVFVDGVQSYCEAIAKGRTEGPEFRETEAWVLRSEEPMLTSFPSLCAIFSIDARKLRLRMIDFRQNPRAIDFADLRAEAA